MTAAPPLVCPGCAASHPASERFCPRCHMPLVHADRGGERPASERQRRARKVKPQYSEGTLVRVAGARNQAEAEFIQGLLLEEGVPSMHRRAAGFDVPDFLAAGPRDIMVAASGHATAREVLLQSELISEVPTSFRGDRPARVLAGLLGAFGVVALIAWVGTALS